MEFQFKVKEILPGRITIIESKKCNSVLQVYSLKKHENICEGKDWICDSAYGDWDTTARKEKENLKTVIDQMGLASSKAQDLTSPITTFDRLLNSYQQKLYVVRDVEQPYSVFGFLKIAQKRLFVYNDKNTQYEVDAMCISDFYIHESRQRRGYGHELFEIMLKNEKMEPAMLAIDRPFFKLLSFLNKHYNLKDPKHQPNNFVVYEGFLNRAGSQVYGEKFSKLKDFEKNDVKKSFYPLQGAPVSSSNQSTCSCVEKCPHRNEDSTSDDYFKKKQAPGGTNSERKTAAPYPTEHETQWGTYDSMHSYKPDSSKHSSKTPGDNEKAGDNVERKWSQLESSWNVLGVEPLYYADSKK